jgi:hypothetical protein
MDGPFSIDYSSSPNRDCVGAHPHLRQEPCAGPARNHKKVPFGLETPPFPVDRRPEHDLMARMATLLVGWRPYALLGVLCLALYLPGMSTIPVLDRDEARFAQATRQMLETGDFLHIRFQNEARNQKPAGIYWLQAAAVSAFSDPASTAIWPYRLPSLIGASVAVLLTFGLGRALLGARPDDTVGSARTAATAAVLLAAAIGTMAEAHIAKTDATLLAAIVAGQGALGLAYIRGRAGNPVSAGVAALFWAAEIAAILLKGPVAPALALLTIATLSIADRDAAWLRTLRPLAGSIVTVLIIAPWLYAIEQATEGRFLADSLGHDFLSKLLGGQESHGAPPFYYLTLSMVAFWPGSVFLAPALIRGWQRHEQPLVRFLLAWIVPALRPAALSSAGAACRRRARRRHRRGRAFVGAVDEARGRGAMGRGDRGHRRRAHPVARALRGRRRYRRTGHRYRIGYPGGFLAMAAARFARRHSDDGGNVAGADRSSRNLDPAKPRSAVAEPRCRGPYRA